MVLGNRESKPPPFEKISKGGAPAKITVRWCNNRECGFLTRTSARRAGRPSLPGAASLRFWQGWGFCRRRPWFPVTGNLNPHPLKKSQRVAHPHREIPQAGFVSTFFTLWSCEKYSGTVR